MKNFKYFISSLIVTILGLVASFAVGYYYSGTIKGAMTSLFLATILSVLEVSLSFDNAVVNASVLKEMTPLWRKRFITWGMLIAVFGMRLVFPLVIVSVLAQMGPWEALVMAATKPDEYARTMLSAHSMVAGFGGSFLLMVALKYFFDPEKGVHWFDTIEKPLTKMGKIEAVELALCLIVLLAISHYLPEHEHLNFLIAGIFGLITFVATDGVSSLLNVPSSTQHDLNKASAGMFLYLEVLDASFSFDGVVGAFALTNNLFIISIGLGIGAMFVRSLTILLVEKGTLDEFPYLEHGAFYAIGALAAVMLLDTFVHIPEAFTGLIGAVFIGLSIYSSVKKNRHKGV